MQKFLVPLLVGAIVVGGGSFYGGMQFATSKADAAQAAGRGARGGFGGGQGRNGGPGGGGFIAGDVLSKDTNTLTLKMRDGSSKIIVYSTSTKVGKMTDGSMNDVAQGTTVSVTGTPNSDGSVTASMIQIRPAMPAAQAAPEDPKAREIVVTASNFKFDPATITAHKGEKIRIRLKNADGFHDWKIDEFNAATPQIGAGEEATVEFTPDKVGTFEYYCSVGSHRAMGMKGTLTVVE